MKPVRNLLLFLCFVASFIACKKDSFTQSADALLTTAVDTLHFDTVFTATGSVTQAFRIRNENDKGIHIASVRLAGGSTSPFKINVDGTPGPEVRGVDVGAHDSVYVFVTVNINPNTSNPAFLVQDSIEINYNTHKKWVQLDAFGQNAHFFRNRKISASETWNNDLPYVILDRLTVDTNAVLTINKGCRIYMHADAPFIVNGTLEVHGEKFDSTRVVFSGDRLDEPYRDFPASYPGLIFSDASKNNFLQYAIVKNAYQGMAVTGSSPGTKLTLNEVIIDNAYDAGLIGIGTSIKATNLLVSNCGKNIILVKGGNYNFSHCTAATFSASYVQHKEPVLAVTNFLTQNGIPATAALNASFRNCIFWGESNGLVTDEVVVLKQGNTPFNVSFDQVLWRVENPPSGVTVNGVLNNQNPRFDSVNTSQRIYSFRLKGDSPALNKGANLGIVTDLDGRARPVGLPDLGAYEKQ